MKVADEIEVVPATADRWEDVTVVFGTKGDPSRCWCQWFRMRNAEWRQARTAANKDALRLQVTAATVEGAQPPGVLAYVDGEPAGWCAVAPRAGYPRLVASPMLRILDTAVGVDDLTDSGVWSITCFVVRVGSRRMGVARALLDAAITLARQGDAHTIEAYPVDVDAKASVSSSELYHGTSSMFLAAGFTEVARHGAARPVMRLDLR